MKHSAGYVTTAVIALHLALAAGCGSAPAAAGESCSESGECAGGHVCVNGRCTAAQVPGEPSAQMPMVPATPRPMPVPEPVPSPVAVDTPAPAITEGRHRCSFTESGSQYNRQCTVVRQPDGSFRVSAPGTDLNPDQGFDFVARGSAPAYQVDGSLRAFEACDGAFSAVTALEKRGEASFFVIRWGSCSIRLRV